MASIARTAYPRFRATLSAQELQTLYAPTEEEREFVATHAWTDTQQLTLLTLLKCGLDHRIGHFASRRPQRIERITPNRG